VWIPKYRKNMLYGQIRKKLGLILKELARQKEGVVVEGHLVADHVHMLIINSAEICGSLGHRFSQREERHMGIKNVRQTAELHRPEFLGQRILCIHDGIR